MTEAGKHGKVSAKWSLKLGVACLCLSELGSSEGQRVKRRAAAEEYNSQH